MKPRQIADVLLPFFASLFLVLSLCALLVRTPKPTGLQIPMLRVRNPQPEKWLDCGETRIIVVTLNSTGELKINQDAIGWNELSPRIGSIMKFRAEHSIYVRADPEVSYQQFAALTDRIAGSASNMQIGLLTNQLLSIERYHLEGPCSMEWPPYVSRT